MTPDKINCMLISMFSKFIVCVNVFIIKARVMYMPTGYDELVDEYVDSSHGWLLVCHDGWDSIIKQFFGVSMYWIDLWSWIQYKLAHARWARRLGMQRHGHGRRKTLQHPSQQHRLVNQQHEKPNKS
jgi:hypothetical protein